MPALIAHRHFPMPSVSLYTVISVALLACSILWAQSTIYEEQHRIKEERLEESDPTPSQEIGIVQENATANNITSINITSENITSNFESENQDSTSQAQSKRKEYKNVWTFPKSVDGEKGVITVSVKKTPIQDEEVVAIAAAVLDKEISFSYGVFSLMLLEPITLILLVNASYCLLALFVQVIQVIVFGRLRMIEAQHMKDKFWNFVFYKFIFVFGVMNVQSLNEALIWVSWFTAIAFLLLLTKLCKDRFEFLSFSPNTPVFYHWKVIALLVFLLLCCCALSVTAIFYIYPISSYHNSDFDYHSLVFMLTECAIISVKSIHIIMRYGIHLYDIRHEELWEHKATIVYHVDLSMELLSLCINFAHHIHMLFSGNIWLSMASLVICMQLRYIITEIQKRLRRHKNYRRVVANMEAQFPAATREEIAAQEDQCAICWDQMENARKLPCNHLFHSACLRSWLEQDTTCPTCRKQLGIRNPTNQQRQNGQDATDGNNGEAPNPAAGPQMPRRNFWHFDGTRIAHWFPSFSVEVTHTPHGAQAMVTTRARMNQDQQASNSQLDAMVREVQDIFPQIPAQLIRNDLLVSGSVESTSERILDGRVAVPPLAGMARANMPPPVPPATEQRASLPQETSPGTYLRRRHQVGVLPDDDNLQVTSSSSGPSAFPFPQATVRHNSTPADSPSTSRDDVTIGGRFSKAPTERETVLRGRREEMVREARLRYLEKKKTNPAQAKEDKPEFPMAKYNSNVMGSDKASTSSLRHTLEDDLDLTPGFGRSVTPPSGSAMAGLVRDSAGRVSHDYFDSDSSE